MTALLGLMTYVELMHAAGLRSSVERRVGLRGGGQGWTDSQIITSLILLNLAGGESVMDLEVLEKDACLCRVLRHAETHGMRRRELLAVSYPAISLATATVGRHRCPQKRLQTARQPPVYPNSSPDHRACNSLTPFRCPHAVHPCPSVDSGLGGESGPIHPHSPRSQRPLLSLTRRPALH